MNPSNQALTLLLPTLCMGISNPAKTLLGQDIKGQLDTSKRGEPTLLSSPALDAQAAHHILLETFRSPDNCGTSPTISMSESWHIAGSNNNSPAFAPAAPKRLTGLHPRTLGSAPVDPSIGNFDIQWMEENDMDRMSWVSTRHLETGQPVIAYRVLTLLAGGSGAPPGAPGTTVLIGTPVPDPILMFTGNETSKNMRRVTVTCTPRSEATAKQR